MMDRFMRILLIAAIGMFTLVRPAAAATCESVASTLLQDGKITSATLVAAGAFMPPPESLAPPMGGPAVLAAYKNMPAFCRVRATLTPTPDSDIKIEVWMPAQNWNGKLVGNGNGIWAGSIGYFSMAEPVTRGYAVVATDTGHVGNGMDGRFAVGHRQKLIDFGYRAVHEMTVKAKVILAAYYGRKEQTSLWVSCSTGGRQGLMEAYRYPADYNGISAMAPANPMVNLMIGTVWTGYAAIKDEAHRLTMSNMMAVHKAYIEQCDARDGLKDGIVADPEDCHFDPASLECKGKPSEDCLTAAQVEALRDIYAGPKNPRTGARIFAGYEPGSELQLIALIGGKEPFPVATSYFRDLVFQNPNWDFKSYNYDTDLAASYKTGSDILDVPSDGLAAYLAGRGKLLLSHGWSDGLIPAPNTVAYYKAIEADLPAEETADSVRLFMVPGMGHCGGGDAPTVTDMLSVIDGWVKTGKPPEKIIAKSAPGQKPASRPICAYPQYARYKGSGDPNDASSFVCTDR